VGEVYTWRLILSQIKLAEYLGVDDSTVNKMEAGSRRPSVEVLGLKVTFTLQAEHSDLTDQEVDGLLNLKLYQPN
jgi:transcriptional regulator with XRE-family HTH domain